MAIAPILPIAPISVSGVGQVGNTTSAPTAGSGAGGTSFGDVLTSQLDRLSAAQTNADQLALQAATGDLQAVQDYTIAATEAQLLTQLTVAIRNKAIDAFNEIMRMQV